MLVLMRRIHNKLLCGTKLQSSNFVVITKGFKMANIIEEQLMKCKKCSKTTKHHRNNSKSSGFMLLVHLVLTVCTVGVWLILIIIWKILNSKIGGWACGECS